MKLKFLASVFFVLTFAFWPLTVASAEPNGLKVDVYTFDEGALPEMRAYDLCDSAWVSVDNIDDDFDAEYAGVVAGCRNDFVLVHYSGFLTSPVTGDVLFQSWADDGFYMSFDDVPVIENWWLKGCSGGSAVVPMIADVSVKFDAWFYEYGGGACNRLYWDAVDGLNVVPVSAFSQDVVETVIPEPVVPDPEPTVPPVIPDPIVPDPVIPDPVIPEPVVPEPVVPEPPVIPDTPEISPVTPVEPVLPVEPVVIPETPIEPVVEPIIPEPVPEVLSPAEEHQALLDNLLQQAQEDDIQIPEELASIPVLGASIVALTDAINFMGNVGADMSPEVRATAKKEIVAAVVLTQISQFATSQAVASAQASASSGASGSSTKTRRIK